MTTHIDAADTDAQAMRESFRGEAADYETVKATLANTEKTEEKEGATTLVMRWMTPKEARELARKDGAATEEELEDYVKSTGANLTEDYKQEQAERKE